MSYSFAMTFGAKDRHFLKAFIDSCDTTAPSPHEDLNVVASIASFIRGDSSAQDCAFEIAEYLQYSRGSGVELFAIENIFELLTPIELATFIEELRRTPNVELDATLLNFSDRVLMNADVSLEDLTEAIDVLVEWL